ncbi:MAG: CpaF family protein [Bdellovibrionales bacterium]|nr:CpaF family protein [Bdellovibrionales bacterium]
MIDLGPLSPLLSDPSITEIMVNAHDLVFIERSGRLETSNARFQDANTVITLIGRLARECGREVGPESPYFDGYLEDGSRINAVIPPMAMGSPALTIRKLSGNNLTLIDLIQSGSISHKGAYLLHAAVQARLNILICGGTGSGKTTLLNVAASLIPQGERIITIEDVAELRLDNTNWVRLEAVRRPGGRGVTTRECLINALRMRPDRILVGECRKDETFEMLQAMNTGHEGSMTTLHANSPRDCFARIESLVATSDVDFPLSALRKQIASALDLVIHIKRLRDGQRVVHEIVEVTGMEQDTITTQTLLSREKGTKGGGPSELAATGLATTLMERFSAAGIQFPPNFFDPGSKIIYRPE